MHALAALLLVGIAATAAPDPELSGAVPVIAEVTRVAGEDRYATAVAVSEAFNQPGQEVVVIAGGASGVDALAGATLGPVLLVRPGEIPEVTDAELRRLDPEQVVIVGGTAAVSGGVARTLAGRWTVARIAGSDRYATAAAVSAFAHAAGALTAYVADGNDLERALVLASAAARDDVPLLLRDGVRMPVATEDELDRLGATVVSPPAVEGAAVALVASSAPDALAAASTGSPLVMVDPTCVAEGARRELEGLRLARLLLIGGTAALSGAVGEMRSCTLPDTVRYEVGEEVTVAQRAYLRAAVDAARRRWGDPGPLVVQAYSDIDDLVAANVRERGGTDQEWRGFWGTTTTALGARGWLAVRLDRSLSVFRTSAGFMSLVAHEVGHAQQLSFGDVAVPSWLLEGGAEWLAQETSTAEAWSATDFAAVRLARARLISQPLATYERPSTIGDSGEYVLGYAAADYLAELAGDDALLDVFELVADGTPWPDALEARAGVTVEQFYADFPAWLGE